MPSQSCTKILVVYYSSSGGTRKLAHLIAKGIESEGLEAVIRQVPRVSSQCEQTENEIPEHGDCYVQLEDLKDCAGLAVGSPSRFGNMAAPLKYFIDQTSDIWMNGILTGKPVTFFSSASSLHGGHESTLLSMMIPFLHHGMLVMGLPYAETDLLHTSTGGTPYGVSHWSGPNNDLPLSESEKTLAVAQGRRLATTATKLSKS
ncbi:MAG: NAD(P)H:quinone oxidoreductase [Enterobacterales bacterium]|nr:NAD(P)H:quinone oxidoreductase [Enterobacterales bacterium]